MKFLTHGLPVLSVVFGTAWAVPISSAEISGMAAEGYRLLDLAPDVAPVWKTEEEKLDLLRAGVQFVSPSTAYVILLDAVSQKLLV